MSGTPENQRSENAPNASPSIGIEKRSEIPYGYCHCGCGMITTIAKINNKERGHIKGEPVRFVIGHGAYKHGTSVDKYGRVRVLNRIFGVNKDKKYTYRSILVAEKAIGKKLPSNAVVHHINGIASNDNNDNLVVCENDKYHALLHMRKRALLACGDPSYRLCVICHKYDDPSKMYLSKNESIAYHIPCKTESLRQRQSQKIKEDPHYLDKLNARRRHRRKLKKILRMLCNS